MASDIIDFIASFVILILLLTFTVTVTTQILDNALVYQQNQLVSTISTDTFNIISESNGAPEDWGQTTAPPTSFGLKWPNGESSTFSPFTPIRLNATSVTQKYPPVTGPDYINMNGKGTDIYIEQGDTVTYGDVSDLLNLKDEFGWRITYDPVVDVEVSEPPVAPPANWYDSRWAYRKALTINHAYVKDSLADYPLLVSVTDADLKAYAQVDGDDILFTDSNGVTKLDHEIEQFDSATGTLVAWVRVNPLTPFADKNLYIYWGYSTATSQQNVNGVWSAENLLVTHMVDNPSSSQVADSTSPANNGAKTAANEPKQDPGKLGQGQLFDGVNDKITHALPITNPSQLTLEFWAKNTPQLSSQTLLSTGSKSNTAGFIDITRPPSSYDLVFDYAANSNWDLKNIPILDEINLKCMISTTGSKIYAGSSEGRLYEWEPANSLWAQKASPFQPGEEINCLVEYAGKIYAGTSPNGMLLEWSVGATTWMQKAPKLSENTILSLAIYNAGDAMGSTIYAGTGPTGKLYRWNKLAAWEEKAGQLVAETQVKSLAVYGGSLYGGTSPNGKLYKWDGVGAWLDQITPASIYSTIQFNGMIYGGTSGGELYEWDSTELKWIRRAPKLGSEADIMCLAEYNGNLYAGTSPGGRLYQWNGVDAWTQVAPQLGAETSIKSLTVYNSKLYGGTSPNGRLYEWNGVDAWVEDAGPALIHSLAFFNNKIYGGSFTGALYEWDGTAGQWLLKAPRLGTETDIVTLAVYDGKLYGGTSPGGRLYEWDGSAAWVEKAGQLNGQTKINSLAVYGTPSKLYGGTSSGGRLFEWDGVNTWVEVAPQLGAETSINSLAVYNGKLYGGTSPSGRLFEWNGVNAWVEVAPQLFSETSINSLTVFNGKLYGGTSPGGRLYEWNDVNAWAEKLGGWGYRKSHVINPSAGAGTNYQVKITAYYGGGTDSGANVYLNSKSRTDFGDVRFTRSDGTTPLDYWIESKVDGNNAVFWVEVADDLSSVSSTIYLYYGKSDATTTSNGSNTFILFDDFNGPSLDASKWTQKNGGALTFASSQMTAPANGVDPGKIIATGGPTGNNLVLRARFKVTVGTSVDERAGLGVKTGTADGRGYNYVLRGFTLLNERSFLDDGVIWNVRAGSWLKNTWYTEEVYHDGTKINGRFDDGAWQSQTWSGRTGYPALNIGSVNSVTVWDWALIRKIVSSEPSHGSWVETPNLGTETSINSLTVFNGKLYGGTSPNGRLYEWNNVDAWVDRITPTYIPSLAVYNGKIYGGTSYGALYEWDSAALKWVQKAPRLGSETKIASLIPFNGKLYGGTSPNGKLYEWSTGATVWTEKANTQPTQTSINALVVIATKLYGATAPNGLLLEWDGVSPWSNKAYFSRIASIVNYNGDLYAGTEYTGKLFKWDGAKWIQKATPPASDEGVTVATLAEYKGELYGGTYAASPSAAGGRLYWWDQTNSVWVAKTTQPNSQDGISALTSVSGIILAGTKDSSSGGRLYTWSAGDSAWTPIISSGPGGQNALTSLLVYNSEAYACTGTNGVLYKASGSSWTNLAALPTGNLLTLTVYQDKLYAGTSDNGKLYVYDNLTNQWTAKSNNIAGAQVRSLTTYNGKLYGAADNGKLYVWDGVDTWIEVATNLTGYTNLPTLVQSGGRLYASAYPQSHLLELTDHGQRVVTGFFDGYDGVWTSVAFAVDYSAKVISVYRNGALYKTLDASSGIVAPSTTSLYVGSYGTKGNYYAGSLDELRVSTTLRSAAWISATYTNQVTPSSFYRIFPIDSTGGLKLKVRVTGPGGVLPQAALDVNFFYTNSYDAGGVPVVTQHPLISTVTDDSGVAIINYPSLDPSVTYFAIVRARQSNLFGVGYATSDRTNNPSLTSGSWTNPTNAYVKETPVMYASTSMNGAQQVYSGYGFKLGANEKIDQIQIRLDAYASATGQQINVEVSRDAGSSWHPASSSTSVSTTPTAYYFDVTDQWGLDEWTPTMVNDNNLQVRVTFMQSGSETLYLDWAPVEIRVKQKGLSTPVAPFVTDYTNGVITLVHRKTLDSAYPNDDLHYSAKMVLPVGYSEYREADLTDRTDPLNPIPPTGPLTPAVTGTLKLGSLRGESGAILIFTRNDVSGNYDVTVTPWGLCLGQKVAFGETPLDATNVFAKERIVLVNRYTYMVKIEMWKKGGS